MKEHAQARLAKLTKPQRAKYDEFMLLNGTSRDIAKKLSSLTPGVIWTDSPKYSMALSYATDDRHGSPQGPTINAAVFKTMVDTFGLKPPKDKK